MVHDGVHDTAEGEAHVRDTVSPFATRFFEAVRVIAGPAEKTEEIEARSKSENRPPLRVVITKVYR